MPNPHSKNLPDAQFPAQYHDDEISLIDLTKILIRRRWWIVSCFLLISGLGFIYAILMSPVYTYTSVYKVAGSSTNTAYEAPAGLITQINSLFLPDALRQLVDEQGEKVLSLKVEAVNPKDTLLIILATKTAEQQQPLVEALHREVLSRLAIAQADSLAQRQKQLTAQINNLNTLIQQAMEATTERSQEMLVTYSERLLNTLSALEQLTSPEVLDHATQSLRVEGISKKLILILAFVLGGILGIMAAFFAEFATRVRDSLHEDENEQKFQASDTQI